MTRAKDLYTFFDELTWESYVQLSSRLTVIDKHNIPDELERLPLLYSSYSGLQTLAEKEVKHARVELEQYMATERMEEQQRRIRSGTKVTDKSLEAHVTAQSEYKSLNDQLENAQFKLGLLKNLVVSLAIKKDTVIQLSCHARAEAKIYN